MLEALEALSLQNLIRITLIIYSHLFFLFIYFILYISLWDDVVIEE